jgi:hypothetical protein
MRQRQTSLNAGEDLDVNTTQPQVRVKPASTHSLMNDVTMIRILELHFPIVIQTNASHVPNLLIPKEVFAKQVVLAIMHMA